MRTDLSQSNSKLALEGESRLARERMMFVGSGHSASTVETIDVPHTCVSCRVAWTLRLRAQGVGHAVAPFFIGSGKARTDAATAAKYDAQATARLALSFVSCAACGHSLLGLRRHWLTRLAPAFAVLMFAGLMGPLAAQETHDPLRFVYGAVGGAVMCAIVLFSRLRDRTRALAAAESITWFRGEPPDKPYVGLRCSTCRKKIKSTAKGERCPQCGAPTHRERCAREHAFGSHGRDDQGAYRQPT